MKFPTSAIMTENLKGLKGLEIGAGAHNPFGLDTLNVDYVQHSAETFSGREQYKLCGEVAKVDIIADACNIPVGDKSFDFVINSHVFEHMYSPMHAIWEWSRIARKYIAMIIPEKTRCGEKDMVTTMEIIRYREATYDPAIEEQREDRHWTHWTVPFFREFAQEMGLKIKRLDDKDDKVGNGFLVIIEL